MPTKIVFVGGTEVEVETPIQNLVRLLEEADEGGLSFSATRDASLRHFVNRDQIVYLEANCERREKPFWVRTKPRTEVEATLSGFSAGAPRHAAPEADQ